MITGATTSWLVVLLYVLAPCSSSASSVDILSDLTHNNVNQGSTMVSAFLDRMREKLTSSKVTNARANEVIRDGNQGTSIYVTSYPSSTSCDELKNDDDRYTYFYVMDSVIGPTYDCIVNPDGTSGMYACDESNLYYEYFMDSNCTDFSSTNVNEDFFTNYEECQTYYEYSLSYSNSYVATYICSSSDDVYSEAGIVWDMKEYQVSYSYSFTTFPSYGPLIPLDPDYGCTEYPLIADVGLYTTEACGYPRENPVVVYSYAYLGFDMCPDGSANITMSVRGVTPTTNISNACTSDPYSTRELTGGCFGSSVLTCV